ncbi:MAG: response regulator transcription factor [Clostridia bacterium]|nr:response regulator transcription factor [Clostridia bacterium]
MLVALCDDEAHENERLKVMIDSCAVKNNMDVRCEAFTSANELLSREKFDLYFLDYFMEEMNGVDLALKLAAKFGGAVTVCFLTNYENAAAEVINRRVYADGFLKKPVDELSLYEKLGSFYRESFRGRLLIRKGAQRETVYTKDILYLEARAKKTALHMFDGEREYNYLLSEFEKEFLGDAGFCRIHRSFSVNMRYVESFDAKSVTLKNGEVLPLKSKNFVSAYRDYIFTNK